ncbi:MAG: sigma 54-interacting transcriptional regulator [Deltaproteobacteria bacterium]|nr:sigma 54-interacting transcriptional regulator [Deltaproteobacteria bacterium]
MNITESLEKKPDIPNEIREKWQQIITLIAKTVGVPAGLIMKSDPPQIEVFLRSETKGNPYKQGERSDLNAGLYCEKVITQRSSLLIPNALDDPAWAKNPDIELGMTYYLGFPLTWPDNEIFGTICILDSKNNPQGAAYKELILEFRQIIENDLGSVLENTRQNAHIEELRHYRDNLKEILYESTDELKRKSNLLEERLRFEEMISDLSAKFINLPNDRIDREIGLSLEQIGTFFHVDRCRLFEILDEKKHARVVHTGHKSHVGKMPPVFEIKKILPWTCRKVVQSGDCISITSLDELPEDAAADKKTFQKWGAKSFMIMPIIVNGSVDYVISVGSIHKEVFWPNELISRLRLVGDIFVNVLNRRLSELALKEAETEYRTLAETTYDWVYWQNPDGTLRYVSPSCERITGYTAHEFMKTPALLDKITMAEDRDLVARHCHENAGKDTMAFQYRIRRKDRGVVWIDHACKKVYGREGEYLGYRVSNRDITDRKTIEVELKKSRERLIEAQRIASLGNWDLNLVTDELFWSQEIFRIFGLESEDFEGTYEAFLQYVHPDDRKVVKKAVELSLTDPEYHYDIYHRIIRPDGNERIVHERAEVLFDKKRKPFRMSGTVQDITSQKKMEKRLEDQLAEINRLKQRLEEENVYLRKEINLLHTHDEIIGQSKTIRKVLKQVEQVAPTSSAVLVTGETGTGKELIARAIHRLSKRNDRVMVVVNCASLPSALIESELFGREKGAYTGALTKQAGRFEIAHGSTILLDEIGELSLELQAKLLRVLQDGCFERLGSPRTIKVDVRIIASTNRDLAEGVRMGTFREDLYYRLNVFPIQVPPLRDRAEDIPLLSWAFINEFSEKMGKRIKSVPKRVMETLNGYAWPGNIRELRNVIEQAMIISEGTLTVRLPREGINDSAETITLDEAEARHITNILERTGWRIKGRQGAAELLGLKPSTLYTKMNRLGIPNKRKKETLRT